MQPFLLSAKMKSSIYGRPTPISSFKNYIAWLTISQPLAPLALLEKSVQLGRIQMYLAWPT